MDQIEIGPVPCNEECQQIGMPTYDSQKAYEECRRFIRNIRHELGEEPVGAKLKVTSNPHDFGMYYEVVCRFDENIEEARDYAYKCESEAPDNWVIS